MHEIRSVDSQENYYNCCHQLSDFKAKMHQIRFWLLWALPQTPLGELTALPQTPFKGPTSKGRGRDREREVNEWGNEKEKGRGKGEGRGKRSPCSDFTI